MVTRSLRRLLGGLGLLALLALLWPAAPVEARSHHSAHAAAGDATFHDEAERREVRRTLDLIHAGGPFHHHQDGVVFGNREGRLPARPRGYYHEYTVETPGASDRGARRIIRGNGGELYYTRDHYRTFQKLDPEALR
ncbi:MAG TPA: ribonuclease domain-containing protein [Thermoanaerobaculia bacterium]|nr:ribonuclease domain-containing protein [Thermoanaerobaculia bacterium]